LPTAFTQFAAFDPAVRMALADESSAVKNLASETLFQLRLLKEYTKK
jgi:hypothetical protein